MPWYQAYNASKHNRQKEFEKANFGNLIDSMCGLVTILSAQFRTEDFSQNSYLMMGNLVHDEFGLAIGRYFRVKFPGDWTSDECYDFSWSDLHNQNSPIDLLKL